MTKQSIENLLGFVEPEASDVLQSPEVKKKSVDFSFLFFSDVRKDVSDLEKYQLTRDVTLFADKENFTAIYIPERHFYEFGSIYANSAVMASYLVPQTKNIRFRTAGVSLPLHHPAEVVEWWAMIDVLSGGRVDLGFGSGWNKPDFILSPDTFENRRDVWHERIPIVQKLWRGETLSFPGPGGVDVDVTVYPRPIQKELNVWLLVARSDDGFIYAGEHGYNIFTMLYGLSLDEMGKKIKLYRNARKKAGHDPETGIVSLMLHTLVHEDMKTVENAVEEPFKNYIRSSLIAHAAAGIASNKAAVGELNEDEQDKIIDYAYQRYFKTGAVFGTVEDGRKVVDKAIQVGVNDIAFLVDFGVDYSVVMESLPYLKELKELYG